jgi:hypothetical protein
MKTKYYVDAYGPDENALVACVSKAIEIAQLDDEIQRIVIYSHTKKNFMQVNKLFGVELVNKMFSKPVDLDGIRVPIVCATEITYKRECEYRDSPKDVVICCHMDSKAVFKVDDYKTAKYIIALSWTLDGLNEWKMRWKAQNLLSNEINNVNLESNAISLMKTALNEMDVRMFETKTLGHPDDVETCKTYIRTIHKYLPEITPIQVQDYLVTELRWKNKDAAEVGNLLQRLKEGKRFIGGQKNRLKEYYDRWINDA